MQLRPLRDLILIERLEGHGIERVTKGGIIIPAASEKRAQTKRDYFRAKVLAIGPKVVDVEPGEHVLVHTWANGDGRQMYTGTWIDGRRGFVTADDIELVMAPEADVEANQAWA